MKKLIAMSVFAAIAVVSFAKGWDYKTQRKLQKAKDWEGMRKFIDSAKPVKNNEKQHVIYWTLRLDVQTKKMPKDIEAICKAADSLAEKLELTDRDSIDYAKLLVVYQVLNDYKGGYELSKKFKTKKCRMYAPYFARAVKRFGESADMFAAVNRFYLATESAYIGKEKEKTFEYASKALLDSSRHNPQKCIKLVNMLTSFDYSDGDINKADLKQLLTKVKLKYSAKKGKAWQALLEQIDAKLEEKK